LLDYLILIKKKKNIFRMIIYTVTALNDLRVNDEDDDEAKRSGHRAVNFPMVT